MGRGEFHGNEFIVTSVALDSRRPSSYTCTFINDEPTKLTGDPSGFHPFVAFTACLLDFITKRLSLIERSISNN